MEIVARVAVSHRATHKYFCDIPSSDIVDSKDELATMSASVAN